MAERLCKNCKWYAQDYDEDKCGMDFCRCSYVVPFWVPNIVIDYRSWKNWNEGENCRTFSAKDKDRGDT